MKFAGIECTRDQVVGTLKLLDYLRRFLKSGKAHCRDPHDPFDGRLTVVEARRLLYKLIDVAINRKAGVPDELPWEREHNVRLYRDQQRLRDIARRVRVYQFETEEVRHRFGHLLSDPREV